LESVITILSDKGLRVNAEKTTFCANEIEFLGYWISRSGIQPISKKVEAIKNMVHQTTREELRRFIELVSYYRAMWVLRSELLAPLTILTSKNGKLNWMDEHQKALAFLDFSKPFNIYTYASDKELGAVISQDEKPIAFIVDNLIVLNRDIQLVRKKYCQ
jgi:hypothetical protein